jgi:hypothetical protein
MKRLSPESIVRQQHASGWLRMSDLPFGRTLARRLIEEGFVLSVVVGKPGAKRGVRLISKASLDSYLQGLAKPREVA